MPRTLPLGIPLLLMALGQFFLAQSQLPWTLAPGLALVLLGFWKLRNVPSANRPSAQGVLKITPAQETILFILVFLAALFFRSWRIQTLPPGLTTDQGLTGLMALRILHEGWRPFNEIFTSQVPDLLLTYEMAGWFKFVGANSFTFHFFHIIISLAAFPLMYWAFRQWSSPATALCALFILAVMRWHWEETRGAQPSIEVPLYLFAALALFTHGAVHKKPLSLFLSALFCGLGLYAYAALKCAPFLMAWLAYFEYKKIGPASKNFRLMLLFCFLLVVLLGAPLLNNMAQSHSFGKRESESFILKAVEQEKSLSPLFRVWTGTALMFNRSGDASASANLPGRRMLDDGTAVLFLLGLGLAWRRRREREGFYPLACFFTLIWTGLLSTEAAASARLVSLTPFIAYFAGSAAKEIFSAEWNATYRRLRTTLFILWLGAVTAQNTFAYFQTQVHDPRFPEAFGLEQNYIGNTIRQCRAEAPDHFNFFITPFYFSNPTVRFLAYPFQKDVLNFNLADWAQLKIPTDRNAVLFLEGNQTGLVDFFKSLFSGTRVETFRGPEVLDLLRLMTIPQASLKKANPWRRGLQGIYRSSLNGNAAPAFTRWDPVLNFSSLQELGFPTLPPYQIRWTGTLTAPGGEYEFQVLTQDHGALWLDGMPVALEKPVRLASGSHALRVDYEKDSGFYSELHLVWKKPGAENWEVIPASVFGKIKP